MKLPILYSLQHCPYAMRARLGLLLADQQVLLRAIVMKSKPEEMLAVSPKGTVPVLILPDETVIDESLDIMIWALQQNDPEDLLHKDSPDDLPTTIDLIRRNDKEFKPQLEIYKKAKRFRLENVIEERQKCEVFIAELEQKLATNQFFIGQKPGLIDYALLPFVRQFSRVHRSWFLQAPYPYLRTWLESHMQSRLYGKAMAKFPLWLDGHEECLFGKTKTDKT
ncbi:Glutathione S-transferase [Oleispira antarctica RB-8]|uniref:Glutathione S-transferase n=1 Tax=Oleispira antarctica RB-8 TaxID=698738 RepID=R4YM28_OLEAN|nr:Glutathione S-transferase [Oleispira antarctica RB-8]